MMPPELAGKRVLVVEDELLVALLVEDARRCGLHRHRPVRAGLQCASAAQAEEVDLALLDVNVAGENVFSVAHALEERGVPFLFVTGYGEAALPPDRPDWEAVVKPFFSKQLAERLARKINAA